MRGYLLRILPLFFAGVTLLTSCQSHEPYAGVIVIDTDQPVLYDGLLPIGVTLDPGNGGRDLLSPNLLINPDFELATRPLGVGYDPQTREVVTPNGSRLFYPLPEEHYGWEVLGGAVSVVAEGDNHYMQIGALSTDSIVAVKQSLQGFEATEGTSYMFTVLGSSLGVSELCVSVVDDSLKVCSNIASISLPQNATTLSRKLTIDKAIKGGSLLLEVRVSEGEPVLIESDSISYWSSKRKALVRLDSLSLMPDPQSVTYGLSNELVALLDSLSLGFIRFPGGTTANGLYPGTYPVFADSLPQKSLWTLQKNEYRGSFSSQDFFHLSKHLKCPSILVMNFGFTDPDFIQRVEDIKSMSQTIVKAARLMEEGNDDTALQLGYHLGGAEYDRRFTQLVDELSITHDHLQLIRASDASPYHKYSDYTEDVVLPKISFDALPAIDSIMTGKEQYLYPQMMSEVYFESNNAQEYFLPPLSLRAAFLILAEQRSAYVKSLGIAPLLSTDEVRDFPLIAVVGGHYRPTLLYEYLRDYQTYRGALLPKVDAISPISSDILVSITCDKEQKKYYLKAVNVTRHPLNYQLKVKGKNSDFSGVKIISYTSTEPTTSMHLEGFTRYERKEDYHKLPLSSSISYRFAPYEVVIFCLE